MSTPINLAEVAAARSGKFSLGAVTPPETDEVQVVVYSPPVDRQMLLEGISAILAVPKSDARIRVHSLPGLLPDRMRPEQAERLRELIVSAGGDAEIIPVSEAPYLISTKPVHEIICKEEGLTLKGWRGEDFGERAWSRLATISVGVAPVSLGFSGQAGSGRFGNPLLDGATAEMNTSQRMLMWLVFDQPFEAFRIDAMALNYEGLGSQKSLSAAPNLRLLLATLEDHAWAAEATPATQAFRAQARSEEFKFTTEDDLQRRTLLHFLHVRRQRRRTRVGTGIKVSPTPAPVAAVDAIVPPLPAPANGEHAASAVASVVDNVPPLSDVAVPAQPAYAESHAVQGGT